jgi:hypothetical protein
MHPKLEAPDRYVDWRESCLRTAGFESAAATAIARETAFDLHALLELVDRGCPPVLAARILAPLESEAAE